MKIVSNIPQIVAIYPRQAELENTIIRQISKSRGIKETELWLMVMAAMKTADDTPPICIITGTIHRMIQQRRIIGIDYSINGYVDTFLLPAQTEIEIITPGNTVKTSPITVLQDDS